MRIDLHTHSNRSDGTDDPGDLIAHAASAGLDVIALTDHDTTSGWAEAQVAADHHAIRLIRGIEISTKNEGRGQHLLGYAFDPSHAGLTELLRRGVESRDSRLPAILDKLRESDVDLDVEAVLAEAPGGGVVGRPHIADAMIRAGVVADRAEAFETYLRPGGRAYVERYAPTIEEAIAAVAAAGGVTVIAHPRGNRGREVSDERFAELHALGLAGIEVDHQEHDGETRRALRTIATELGMVMTGSSDYHGTGKVDHDLGCNLTEPDQLERLLERVRR